MKTPRLYWDDPLLLEFEATVAAIDKLGDRPAIELDATAFYPEAGGQLADRGVASWDGRHADVVDAQDLDGRVLHALAMSEDVPPPAPGTRVRVRIDEARRRDHMAQHTGQHMLSRALLDVAGAATVSSRLGETLCTIDTPLTTLSDRQLDEAERLVARVVLEDRPVRALRPTAAELAGMKLRRELKVTDDVRVLEIEGFDLSACGGTHCQRTGQVGMVKIVGVEGHKGGLRLSFHAGLRALRDYSVKHRVVAGLAGELTCGVEDLPGVLRKLRETGQQNARDAGALRERLARMVAAQLVAAAPRVGSPPVACVTAVLADEPVEYLRALAGAVAQTPDAAAMVAGAGPAGVQVVVQRGEAARRFDAGAALKRVAAACGGRGGGRPERAEGRLPPDADVKAAAEAEWRRLE